MDVFCIHLPHRTDRMANIQKLQRFYPSLNIHVVEGIQHERGLTGCLLSHQKIVRMAKEQGRPYVWVIEDDCKLLPGNGTVISYVKRIASYLADNPTVGIVNGCGNLGEFKIDTIRAVGDMFFMTAPQVWATHCIFYSQSCYDAFLDLDPGAIIDTETNKMKLVFTFPFLATQVTSFSDITKRDVNYENIIESRNYILHVLRERKLYKE